MQQIALKTCSFCENHNSPEQIEMQQRDVSEAGQNFQPPWLRNLMRMRRVYRTGFLGNRLMYALDTAPPLTKKQQPKHIVLYKMFGLQPNTKRNR